MSESRKRIGFVDYDLNNFHANVYLGLIRNELKGRGYSVAGCTAMKKAAGRKWAAANGVPFFDSVAELDPGVDFYVVLAPGEPQTHLELCRQVFPFRKTTYVDKTFAPDLATARKIFALADRCGVAMQTSSALRYTNVQDYVRQLAPGKVRHMAAWGGGRSFGEYAIHPVELVVSCMGPKVESLMRRGRGNQSQLLANFTGGRTAVINVYTKADTPFSATVTTDKETRHIVVDSSAIFRDMAAAILDLFDAGRPSIDRAESLAIRRILDAAGKPAALKRFVKL